LFLSKEVTVYITTPRSGELKLRRILKWYFVIAITKLNTDVISLSHMPLSIIKDATNCLPSNDRTLIIYYNIAKI